MRLTILLALLVSASSFAGGEYGNKGGSPATVNNYHTDNTGQDRSINQGQTQGQTQNATATNDVDIGNESNANINIEGRAQAPDVVLVPQGHTANCQRTYGLSFSDANGGGGIGWPYRDKSCDYDNNTSNALAAGQHTQATFWMCQKKSSYKVFKRSGLSKTGAIQACIIKMSELYVKMDEVKGGISVPPPQTVVNCDVGQHDTTHERIFESCVRK